MAPKGDILKGSQHFIHNLTKGQSCPGRRWNFPTCLPARLLRTWGQLGQGKPGEVRLVQMKAWKVRLW